jgi:hypothetical protein
VTDGGDGGGACTIWGRRKKKKKIKRIKIVGERRSEGCLREVEMRVP